MNIETIENIVPCSPRPPPFLQKKKKNSSHYDQILFLP